MSTHGVLEIECESSGTASSVVSTELSPVIGVAYLKGCIGIRLELSGKAANKAILSLGSGFMSVLVSSQLLSIEQARVLHSFQIYLSGYPVGIERVYGTKCNVRE